MNVALFLGLSMFFGLLTGISLVIVLNIIYRKKQNFTPQGGGIFLNVIIALLFLLAVPILRYIGIYTTSTYSLTTQIHLLVLPLLLFLPSQKKIYQIIVTLGYAIFFYGNVHIPWVNIPLLNTNLLLGWFVVPLIAVLTYVSARGFEKVQAIDGLPLGSLIITLIGIWAVAHSSLDTVSSIFLSIWLGATVAMQYFQFSPVRIQIETTSLRSQAATLVVFSWLIGKPIAVILMSSFLYLCSIFPLVEYTLKNKWPRSRIMFRGLLICIVSVLIGMWASVI